MIMLALLAGCAGPQPLSQSTAAPAPTALLASPTAEPAAAPEPTPAAGVEAGFDAEAVRAAIQATVDDYARAYSTGDAELLRSTVDQSNAPFRRLVQERFDTAQESSLGQGSFTLEVLELRPRELGFVQATVERDGRYRYDWLFREVEGRWLLSEPSERQLGERYSFESEHFIYEAYHWADDVNEQVAELMERARTQVVDRLGVAPEGKFTVRLRPIFGITPPSGPNALAWYASASRPRGDRMHINLPGGYQFGGYDTGQGWQEQLYWVLAHEYTHLVNQRSIMPNSEMRDWMYEGLAEYVADNPRSSSVSAAVRSGNIIPIVDPAGGVRPQDLDHLYLLDRDVSLAYGLSYSLVAYIVEQHGGLDTLWALARTMKETPGTGAARYDRAMREALGVSFEQFDGGWRAWLEENY
jgi:hypothetical protein